MKDRIEELKEDINFLEEKNKLVALNKSKVKVTVVNEQNSKLESIKLTGLNTLDGGEISTDANGLATGYIVAGANRTINVNSAYADLTGSISLASPVAGELYEITLQATTRNYLQRTNSSSIMFTPRCTKVDFSICGGGGGGGGVAVKNGVIMGGGGGGGELKISSMVPTPNTNYPVTIGSGGSGGASNAETSGSIIYGGTGKDGGESSFFGTTARGGKGGGGARSDNVGGTGGTGYSGNGGAGGNFQSGGGSGGSGKTGFFSSYSETASIGGGGGGGGIYPYGTNYESDPYKGARNAGPGGTPYGGGGVGYNVLLSNGTFSSGNATGISGGGGGAGGQNSSLFANAGGSGYRGALALRMTIRLT